MNRCFKYILLLFFSLSLLCGDAPTLHAAAPTERIKEKINHALTILQKPNGNTSSNGDHDRQKLKEVLVPLFDFAEMAKRSMGRHWSLLKAKQKEFVSTFTDFMEEQYLAKFESLKAVENEWIVYLGEQIDRNLAQVDTKIVPAMGDEMSIRYRLHLVNGEWKVYDVLIGKVSLVDNYRSQFHRVLSTNSYEDLIRKLREKVSEKRKLNGL